MFNHKWHIILAPENSEWITSDNPVVCLKYFKDNTYNFDDNWNIKNGEILFPLTPNHLMYTQIGNNKISNNSFSNDIKFIIQKILIEHSHRFVYASSKTDLVRYLKPRISDKEIFAEEKRNSSEWHPKSILLERDLMNFKNRLKNGRY